MNLGPIRRYHIHGLEVDSPLPMSARAGTNSTPADLRVELVPPAEHGLRDEPVAGAGSAGAGYQVFRLADGFVLRFDGAGDFAIDQTSIRVSLRESCPADLASIVLAGGALSLALLARGCLALHASAVCSGLGAVALVGSSGMGKSTVAGLLCAAGADLLADDVLRIEFREGLALAHAGSPELRLRATSRSIAELLPRWQSSESVDGRLLARADERAPSATPLRAVVVLDLRTEAPARATLTRLGGSESLVELLRHPRVLGWTDTAVLEFLTTQLAMLARSVPILKLTARRGAPLTLGLAEEFAALLEVQ